MSDEVQVEKEASLGAGVIAGILHATAGAAPSSPTLLAELERAEQAARQRTDDEPVRRAVRDLLRHGRYKPTGRAKPASEYLLGVAREGEMPRINNLVDINNLVSLETLLPASVIDVERAGTRRFWLRRGGGGESYVFNGAGHSIELTDLLLVAARDGEGDAAGRPCANPVKDSMATKVNEATREVLVVLYAPASLAALVASGLSRYAALLAGTGAQAIRTSIV
jgi:DNA/RNA-binding domain of Phe-tRNA-synthetase-like protein